MSAFQWHGGRHFRRGVRDDQRVTREEAERRVLAALDTTQGTPASVVADAIWPGHTMKPQAAALAAGGILGRMERRHLVGRAIGDGGWVRR